MSTEARSYRRTPSGAHALTSGDTAVPSDYRRVLGVLEASGSTPFEVIRGILRHYSDALLVDLMGELKDLGYVEVQQASPATHALDLAAAASPVEMPAEAKLRLDLEAAEASKLLAGAGAAFAEARLKHRVKPAKAPADTVVLIVEDDPDQLALADLRATMAGYAVRVAQSAAALQELLRANPSFDLLLLDVMLPDGDGFEILARLRRHPNYTLLPVVLLTAKADLEDIRRGLALGADGYVTKPYSRNILGDAIRRVLAGGQVVKAA